MPRRQRERNLSKFRSLNESRIVGIREAGFSYRAVAARVQRSSSTIMRVFEAVDGRGSDSWEIREWTLKCDVSSR
ncbi:hypothetical protein TNCV_5025771 [Trichonephila clavipes]|nr:hypothetical protein TNCV_5025771 [Trichonephila clavipes]